LFLGFSLLSAAPKKEKKGAKPAAPGAAVASATNGTLDPKGFVIGTEDVLVVRVWRDPEVSGQVVVRPDGKITLQLLGDIRAAGLTPEALTDTIFDGLSKLKKTIDKSEVTVTVLTVNSRKYFIQGEVYKAGQTFFEPPGIIHLVAENASDVEPARILAVFVADEGSTLTTYLE